ncbi:MAG: cobalamin-dependent protein [Anaerolineae bacterium]|nr:cobalamin-dependent protein [Anaerolineae bacterium]
MNKSDKHTLLVNNLVDLEETSVLALVKARVQAGEDPFEIIEDAQQAMRLVGERYEQGHYFISSMMMAGEIFREVLEIVEPILEQKTTGSESGHILLGTVQGDIHDIGKNIFATLLRCHGFTVADLGVDVSPAQFAQEALRIAPDIIALSGLLTIAFDSMKKTVQEIKKLDDQNVAGTPFLIGGGMVNAMICAFVGADYWATDAMVGVQLCKQILQERDER